MLKTIIKRPWFWILSVGLLPLLWWQKPLIPVQNASSHDWNAQAFWYEPWGVSGVHKGIDIFAPMRTPVLASVSGLVVYAGELAIGGKVVALLGLQWRLHYFAHLDSIQVHAGSLVQQGAPIGAVGTSGNAAGKPPHLHFSVISLLPLPWQFSTATQGWKRLFYLNPDQLLR